MLDKHQEFRKKEREITHKIVASKKTKVYLDLKGETLVCKYSFRWSEFLSENLCALTSKL